MKKTDKKRMASVVFVMVFLYWGLLFGINSYVRADDQGPDPTQEEKVPEVVQEVKVENGKITYSTPQSANAPSYIQGKLIVKLAPGKTVNDLKQLNTKYNVSSFENIFQNTLPPQESLVSLKNRLAELNKEHKKWYWQVDKNSNEYKAYIQRIESEKNTLTKQIQALEELTTHLEKRQARAPQGIQPPELKNTYLLKTKKETNIKEMAEEYMKNPSVAYAEPNNKVKAQMVPNDPYYLSFDTWGQGYGDSWGLLDMSAESAWDISQGDAILVAVVDTGIDYNHEDIAGNIWSNAAEIPDNGIDDDGNGYVDDVRGYDFAYSDNDPIDGMGHGTHVAGIIAAVGNNEKGIIGIAPKAKLMPVKGLDDLGAGSSVTLAQCLFYAADNGADVINNSWGGLGRSFLIEDAVKYAHAKGCVVVAAAGNYAIDASNFTPASINEVITVSSIDHMGQKSDFSNYGVKIDVAAPGGDSDDGSFNRAFENILSLRAAHTDMYGYGDGYNTIGENYYRARGTSMACPYVAGISALILAQHPEFSNEEVRSALRASALNSVSVPFDVEKGYGRTDAYLALQFNSVCIAKITSPQSKTVQKGENLEIKGIASGNNFQSYIVEYAVSLSGPWAAIGGASYTQVNNDTLATWTAPANGQYFLRLTVTDTNNKVFRDIVGILSVYQELHSGWPQYIGASQSWSAPYVVADIDNDGKKEIIAATLAGKVYAFKEDGSVMPGWPVEINSPIVSDISVADVDNDGSLEVFFASYNQNVYGYHYDGSVVQGWPQYISEGTYSFYGLLIGRKNKLASPEIIVLPSSPSGEFSGGYAYIFKGNGTLTKKWLLYDLWNRFLWSNTSACLGDVNNDGQLELVIPLLDTNDGNFYLYIFSLNGDIVNTLKLDGVPIDNLQKGTGYISILGVVDASRPVIGDLDGDGDMEIAISRSYRNSSGYHVGKLFLWSYDNGNFTNTVSQDIQGGGASQLALADMDNDGSLEVVAGMNYLSSAGYVQSAPLVKAFHYDGSLLWQSDRKIFFSTFASSPIIGDINNDGKNEVIMQDKSVNINKDFQSIHLYDNNGIKSSEYKIPANFSFFDIYAPATLDDLDNNGKVDLIGCNPTDGFLGVWDLGGTYQPDTIAWPMFGQNPQRTGLSPQKGISGIPIGLAVLNNDDTYAASHDVTVALTAADDQAIVGYYISENQTPPAATDPAWAAVTPVPLYQAEIPYTLSAGDGQKTAYAWFKDAADNISAVASDTIIVDSLLPQAAISINYGALYTTTPEVVLSLAVDDNLAVTGYYLSEHPTVPLAVDAGWVRVEDLPSYATDISYIFYGGDGQKTIYLWAKDIAGNISSVVSAGISLDTIAPLITITSPTASPAYTTSINKVTLGGSVFDATSGISSITWDSNRGPAGSGTINGTANWSIANISLLSGDNIISVYAFDNAGNMSMDTITITYKTCPLPLTPSNLQASKASPGVKLTWKDNANNETGFKIERRKDGGSFSQIAILGKDACLYTDKQVQKGIKYYYRVRAYNNFGTSSYSNCVDIVAQ